MDLNAVRTVLAAAAAGRFEDAADELSITQQAVSKRIAALERHLGVRLFARTPRGVRVTTDGEAFLPHARALLHAEQRAIDSVRPGRRALRVDVVSRRVAPASLLRAFHRARPDVALDVVALDDADSAITAVASGEIDASFRAVVRPARHLPDGVATARVFDEPHHLLTGGDHDLADAGTVTPADLAGHRISMPGLVPGAEWTAYYDELAVAFGLTIDAAGPNFGTEVLLDAIASSPVLATLVGEGTRLDRPVEQDLRRVAVRDPAPVYPHSLVWRADNPHPALPALRDHLGSAALSADGQPPGVNGGTWLPTWARRGPHVL